MKKKIKLLFWDVENTHSIVATFPMWKANISHEAVIQDWFILCGSWKWQGKDKIHSVSLLDDPVRFKEDHTDDYYVIAKLHDILSEADAIVAHNGDTFDYKKFNARSIVHGFGPLPNIVQIDTLKMARSKFKFTYNKLDWLADKLGVGRKLKTDLDLWMRCLRGERKAIKEMVTYNKVDVEMLEGVYDKLAPFCPSKLNQNHFTEERVCSLCGSTHITKQGFKYTRAGKQQQLKCRDCGSWSTYPVSKTGKEGLIR